MATRNTDFDLQNCTLVMQMYKDGRHRNEISEITKYSHGFVTNVIRAVNGVKKSYKNLGKNSQKVVDEYNGSNIPKTQSDLPIQQKKFEHLMLDIETMGNESFSSIVSIGALEFDIETGETGKEFYLNVDLQSCIDAGLIINASTVMWWLNQSEQARKDLTESAAFNLNEALMEFSEFCDKDYQVWGNSAKFDCGILQNAYNKTNLPIPWDFRKERCVRTLVSFHPEIKDNYPSMGTAHNALSDCYFQVGYCSTIWQKLNKK